jgi:hypothetical protein
MASWLLKIYKEGEMKLVTFLSLAHNGIVWSASCHSHCTFGRKIPHYAVDVGLRGLQSACGGGERNPSPCHEVKPQLYDHFAQYAILKS